MSKKVLQLKPIDWSDPEAVKAYNRAYYRANWKTIRERQRKYKKEQSKDLTDNYLFWLLKDKHGIDREYVTPEMLEMYRDIIRVKRSMRDGNPVDTVILKSLVRSL